MAGNLGRMIMDLSRRVGDLGRLIGHLGKIIGEVTGPAACDYRNQSVDVEECVG